MEYHPKGNFIIIPVLRKAADLDEDDYEVDPDNEYMWKVVVEPGGSTG